MKREDARTILDEVYTECATIFPCGIHDAYLYGSYARGDDHDGSDVDILLTVDLNWEQISNYRRAVAHAVSNLSLKHDVTVSVSVNPLDIFLRFAELPYYKNVRSEGIRYGS